VFQVDGGGRRLTSFEGFFDHCTEVSTLENGRGRVCDQVAGEVELHGLVGLVCDLSKGSVDDAWVERLIFSRGMEGQWGV
jgi:hypothetical protein